MFKQLGYVTRPGAAVLVVPVAAVSAITAGNLMLGYLGLVAYGYFSPYLAAATIISAKLCVRAGLLAGLLAFSLWFWAVVPPSWEFGRWPNAAEWTAFASVIVSVFWVAPRVQRPGGDAGGLRARIPKVKSTLPFVKPRPKDTNGEDRDACWDVNRPSDWSEGDDIGRQYGRIFADQVRQTKFGDQCHPPLAWVLRDMIRQGQYTGLEAGFGSALEQALRQAKPLPMQTSTAALLKHYDTQDRRLH